MQIRSFRILLIVYWYTRSRDKRSCRKWSNPGLIATRSDCGTLRDVPGFAGGKQACKTKNGGRTHTSTCSHFARGSLFRNGAATLAAISWRYFSLFSPIFARPRERRVRKKTPKRTKMSVATPSPLRAPASCGSFRKNRRSCRFPIQKHESRELIYEFHDETLH